MDRGKLRDRGRVLFAILVVGAIFLAIIPWIAACSAVWRTLSSLTLAQLGLVIVAALVNIFTYRLRSRCDDARPEPAQAAVMTQTTTTIANTLRRRPRLAGLAEG